MNIDIKKIGKSSAISLSDEDEKILDNYISNTLKFITEQELLDGKSAEFVSINYNELREDEPKASLEVEEALKNTEDKKYSYFQIKEFVE